MELILEVGSLLCEPDEFTINGKDADWDDFGDKQDIGRTQVEEFACSKMAFLPKRATPEVLADYDITKDEYKEVAKMLQEKLSFGRCSLCV